MISKIQNKFQTALEDSLGRWIDLLLNGDLLAYERELKSLLNRISDAISFHLLNQCSQSAEFKKLLQQRASALAMSKLRRRKIKLQLYTGSWINLTSWYACKAPQDSLTTHRHLILAHWHCIKKATPLYCSQIGMFSVICSSFDVCRQLLQQQGIKASYSRIRDLAQTLGQKALNKGWTSLLQPNDHVEDQRVVIQFDGARSRMREYNGTKSLKNRDKYNTPWREPNIFVIQRIDKRCRIIDRTVLPIYGAIMKNRKESFAELEKVLQTIQIHKARQVQFIADGVDEYWYHIEKILQKLKVPKSRIVFTLDYYHAAEHLTTLVDFLELDPPNRKLQMTQWTRLLKAGDIDELRFQFKRKLLKQGKTWTDNVDREIQYFIRHKAKMKYRKFQYKRLFWGSGIVESAIRRIINLRFKSASSFWIKKNLQAMLFLRCAFLSRRWNIMSQNIFS